MTLLKLYILEALQQHNMKSKGLGDSVEKFTKATGIKKVVDTMSKGLNIPCGCAARKGALNKMFPYK